MAYTTNKFCWHGVVSTDVEKSLAFYPEALGWKVITMPMGDHEATLFAASDGVPRLHVREQDIPNVPSHWLSFLRVEDVDATTATAVENGGTELLAPNDIPPGRFSVVASPSGAAFAIFREVDPEASDYADVEGAIHWTELHSKDLDADVAWLKSTFGYTTDTMPMPDNSTYYILKDNDQGVGGAMKSMSEQAPSMWLSWVRVANCDDAVGRVKQHGGNVMGEIMDMPGVGRMAVVADSTGGVFGVIQPPAN